MGTDDFNVEEVIEQNYNIHAKNINKIKNVYKIDSVNNIQGKMQQYCLKLIKYELPHFLFIIGAITYLQKKGFQDIPTFINTLSGEGYIKIISSKNPTNIIGYAYLTNWIESRECDYESPVDILIATSKLAQLHINSKGFIVTSDMKPRVGWLKWIDNFRDRVCDIENFKKIIEQKSEKSEFDILYQGAIDGEYNRALGSINKLISSDYIVKMEKEKLSNSFCHHDYAHHNVLVEDSGKVNIIDFDYCILDTHLHDLSSLLIRRMKCGNWDVENATYILDVYNSIIKVDENDIPIISAFIQFPQDFWQLGIQYYYEKLPWEQDNFLRRLTRFLDDRKLKQEFLDDFSKLKYKS